MKRNLSLLLSLLTLTLCLLSACGSPAEYRDDVSPRELVTALTETLPVDGGYDIGTSDADYYAFYFNSDPAIDGYAFAFSSASSDVSEIGVLHVSDSENVNTVKALAEAYVSGQKAFYGSFAKTYNAAEMEKLDAACVRVLGNYVFFYILTAGDIATADRTAEDKLK